MISCTEYIPAYSEFFTYLDETYGKEELDRFWEYHFAPTGKGIRLINFLKAEGLKGCYTYWSAALKEEAADVTIYLNEKAGWFMTDMHKCPSKGKLLKLKDEFGFVPYHSYCMHCDGYRAAVEQVGLKYMYDFVGCDRAACRLIIYDPKVFNERVIVDENTKILDIRASENEYYHLDFHRSMNSVINYVGENHGISAVEDYLGRYTRNVCLKQMTDIETRGIDAIADKIRDTYEKEKSPDAVELVRDGGKLTVNVKYCPGVKYLKDTGRIVSPWYRYTTEVVMKALSEKAGVSFKMLSYDEETGAACYTFE